MDVAAQICGLLAQKKERFLEYERETLALAAGSGEEIAGHMAKREALRGGIDALTRQTEELCASDGALRSATRLECGRGELPEPARAVFDAALEVCAVVHRIQSGEPQALSRILEERDAAEERIRELNQGKEAAAARYLKSTKPVLERADRGKI